MPTTKDTRVARKVAHLIVDHLRRVWQQEKDNRTKPKFVAGRWYCVNSPDFGVGHDFPAAMEPKPCATAKAWHRIIKAMRTFFPAGMGVSTTTHGWFKVKLRNGKVKRSQY